MTAVLLLASIATIPYFTFRAFSTMFVVALIARLEWVSLGGAGWLTLDLTIFLLFLLSVLEWWGTRFAKDLLALTETFTKPSAGFLVSQSIVTGDGAILMRYLQSALLNFEHVGVGAGAGIATFGITVFSFIWAGIAAFCVWWLTGIRREVLDAIWELDEDDDLGLRKLINWSEDAWAIGGVVVTFMFPFIAIGMFLLTLGGLFLAKKYVERQEQKRKVPCSTCRQPIHASAIMCSFCRYPNPAPVEVNWLGQPKTNKLVTDLNAHRVQLLRCKRCPECATRLKEKTIHQSCPACFTETFANPQQVAYFLNALNQQLPRTMLISFFLGLIPFLGVIPGVIYYRVSLISSLRGYVPRSTGCVTRWGVRMMNLFLIGFQPLAPIGFFVLPAMCFTNYWIYRGIVERESRKAFGGGYIYRETPVMER